MHYQQGGGKYPIHVSMGSFACREEMHFSEELAFLHLGALFSPEF
jgi:hypothetical protein